MFWAVFLIGVCLGVLASRVTAALVARKRSRTRRVDTVDGRRQMRDYLNYVASR